MPTNKTTPHQIHAADWTAALASCTLALGLLTSGAARAQEGGGEGAAPAAAGSGESGKSPYLFGITQAIIRDDNLFRAPDTDPTNKAVSDTISSTGLRLGVDQAFGRQHLGADLRGNVNRYRDRTELNNTDYNGTVRLDWETVDRVSGTVSVRSSRSLYRDTNAGVVSTALNQLRSTGAALEFRVGLPKRLAFEVGAAGSDDKYTGTDPTNRVDDGNVRQHSFNAGIRFGPSDILNTRLGVRRTEGKYPNYVTSTGADSDEFTRNDIDLTTSYEASGASHLDARVSATRERHTLNQQRNDNGWTGALAWLWRATGKLTVNLGLASDSSVGQTSFDSPDIANGSGSTSTRNQTANLSVAWAATAKISVIPKVTYMRRDLDNSFINNTTPQEASDRTTNVALGLRYQPLKALDLGCDVGREQRRVSGAPGLSLPYDSTVWSCSAQFALR